MRIGAAVLALSLLGCAAGDADGLVDKRDLGGAWTLSVDGAPAVDVGFVITEDYLLVHAVGPGMEIDELDEGEVLAWRIDEHVAAEGDGCPSSGVAGCTVVEDAEGYWYERSRMRVDFWQTLVLNDGALTARSEPTPLEERVDPIAAAERDAGGALRAFEVRARFEGGAAVTYRLAR